MPRSVAGGRTAATNRVAVQDIKSSMKFSGNPVDSRIIVGTPITIGVSSDFTVGGWVNYVPKQATGNNDPHTLFSGNFHYANNKGYLFQVGGKDGTVNIFVGNANYYTSSNLFKYNKWNFLVYEMTGTAGRVYLNDMTTPIATLVIPRKDDDATKYNYFGTENPGTGNVRRIMGNFRSCFAAQSLLTTAQKTALMNSSTVPTLAGGVFYSLNEGAGTTAYDTSGNNNHGVITAGTYTADVPTKKHEVIGGNLVKNGDFEYAPPTNVAQISTRWIDGTVAGGADNIFGWYMREVSGTCEAIFDSSVTYSGTYSLKLSTKASGSRVFAYSNYNLNTPKLISLYPNLLSSSGKSYKLTYRMKTNYVSGDATSGAFIEVQQKDVSGATVASYTPSTIVKTTTDWTYYEKEFTTTASGYLVTTAIVAGQDGTATLIMDAWFDDIELRLTTTVARTVA